MTARIDTIKARLAAAEAPWTLAEGDPKMDGRNWTIRREGKPGIIVSAHEYGFGQLGELIANAPADLAWLIARLEDQQAKQALAWDAGYDAGRRETQRGRIIRANPYLDEEAPDGP